MKCETLYISLTHSMAKRDERGEKFNLHTATAEFMIIFPYDEIIYFFSMSRVVDEKLRCKKLTILNFFVSLTL